VYREEPPYVFSGIHISVGAAHDTGRQGLPGTGPGMAATDDPVENNRNTGFPVCPFMSLDG